MQCVAWFGKRKERVWQIDDDDDQSSALIFRFFFFFFFATNHLIAHISILNSSTENAFLANAIYVFALQN